MKPKGTLFLLFAFLLVSMPLTQSAHGQLRVDVIKRTGVGSADQIDIKAYADVTNTSFVPIDVIIRMEHLDMAENHTSYFCWDVCYTDKVFLSDPLTIQGGQTVQNFSCYTKPNGTIGSSKVRFCYYIKDKPETEICEEFDFMAQVTSVEDERSANSVALASSPSPAANFTRIDFDIPGIQNDSFLSIYNMLGHEVMSVPLTQSRGSKIIDTSNFHEGVYFYAVVANGQRIATKKLVVQR